MCVYCGVVAVLSRCVFSAFASSKVPEAHFGSSSQGEAPKVCPRWSARESWRPPKTVSALSDPRSGRPVRALRRFGAREGGESQPGSTRQPRLAGIVVGSLRHFRHPAWLPGGRHGKLPRHGAGALSMTFSCVIRASHNWHSSHGRDCRSLNDMGLRLHVCPSAGPRMSEHAAFSDEWVKNWVSTGETHDRITCSSARRAESICSSRTFT